MYTKVSQYSVSSTRTDLRYLRRPKPSMMHAQMVVAPSHGQCFVYQLLTEILIGTSGKLLNCKIHKCPQRCHQLQDHSKMKCQAIIDQVCPLKHAFTSRCHEKNTSTCSKCKAEMEAVEFKRQRDYKLEQERLAKQREYATRLAEIDDEIAHEKRLQREAWEDKDRESVLAQKRRDLENLRERKSDPRKVANTSKSNLPAPKPPPIARSESASPRPSSPVASEHPESFHDASIRRNNSGGCVTASSGNSIPRDQDQLPTLGRSEARDDWDWQRNFEGVNNKAVDDLMAMTGRLHLLCT